MDPSTAIAALVGVPFTARLFIAWSIWSRVHGLPPSPPNDPPVISYEDFPAPNRPLRAFVYWLWAVGAALGLALVVTTILDLGTVRIPPAVWWAVYAVPTVPSVVWAFRRLHRDDVLARTLRQQRRMASST